MPTPACAGETGVDLLVWMAELAGEDATSGPPLGLVRAFRASPPGRVASTGHGEERDAAPGSPEAIYHQLAMAAASRSGDTPANRIARRAASGAASLCRGKPADVIGSVRAALRQLVPILDERGKVTEFLEELDQRILCADLGAKHPNVVGMTRVLWARDSLCVGRRGDDFVFLGKLKQRWTALVGSRENVLACVPGQHLDEAAQRVR